MDQEKQSHIYHSAEESPIPVPPVEEGWSMMKQQLDIHQPVTGRWPVRFGRPALWMGAAAVMVTGVLIFWAVASHRTGSASHGTVATSNKAAAASHETAVVSPHSRATATQNNPTSGNATSTNNTATSTNNTATSGGESAHPTDNTHPSNGNSTNTHPSSGNSTTSINRGNGAKPETNNNRGANHNRTHQNPTTPTYNQEADRTRPNQSTHTTGYDPISQNTGNTAVRNLASHTTSRDLTSHTTSRNLASHTTSRDLTSHSTSHADPNQAASHNPLPDHTRAPGPTRRWTTSKTKLARTNPPAPQFIPAADSLLKAIRSGNKTAAASPKSKNKQTGLTLAAGISLGQSIPIGQQQLSSYNLLSDYIPSPYLRLYIGDRWYLQTTPHLLSAQYTPSQLIDSSGGDTSRIPGYPQYLQYNKVTLKKLYYTDIPLTINYRVFKGFYLGAGIQYSRLWQAAGEDRITLRPSNGLGNDSLYSSKIVGLKNNDSVFRKLARSDWRLLLEADYVWRRFTFGLQYQRGLNTYLPVNPSGSKGTDKNSSFSIHIYYEIWDQRRKNN